MKQLLAIAVLVICSPSWEQQNLVPNGSFEEYYSCPIENELPGNGVFEQCKDWWYSIPAPIGTPDYFHSCNNFNNGGNGFVGVPSNFWGYQEAFDGNGYIGMGLVVYSSDLDEITGIEPVQTKLVEPLEPCTEYEFTCYVNLANESLMGFPELSVFLSVDSTSFMDVDQWLEIVPTWTNDKPITDTLGWTKLEGSFVASGAEQFLNIGYFQEFDSTYMYINDSIEYFLWNSYYCYLYIDSVSLVRKAKIENCQSLIPIPNVFTPDGNSTNDYIDFTYFDRVTFINRWGNTVLEMGSQSNFLWYGKNFREEDLPAGVYYYIAEKAGIQQRGSIHLIR